MVSALYDRIGKGYAERLPFRSQSFDASLAILTIHHWSARAAGLAELDAGYRLVIARSPRDRRGVQ